MDEAVHRLPAVAQLLQGADAQAGEGEHPARPQRATRFGQYGGEIGAPLHGEAGEQQVDATTLQGQALGVAGDEVPGAPQRPGMPQHAFGDVQRQAFGLRETRGQRPAEMPGTAAKVEPAQRRQLGRQARQQLAADRALQFGDAVVALRRAGEGGGDLALVRQEAGAEVCAQQRFSHARPRA
ncbi:hypothetical protein D9M70_444940 [compost metagenome]